MSTHDATPTGPSATDVLVVGAGMAGLTAAHELTRTGRSVRVVDKGRAPGGRLATRRVGAATFDHGAQFLTARDPRFRERIATWHEDGVVRTWFTGLPDLVPRDPERAATDDEPRYRGVPTMRSIAEHLADGLDLHLGVQVSAIARGDDGWRIAAAHRDGGSWPLDAGSLLMTAPVPQSLALLDTGGVPLTADVRQQLDELTYDPCIAVLMVPEAATTLPEHGALRLDQPPLSFLTDNLRSGASAAPAVTIHADAEASRRLWDADDERVTQELVAAAAPLLGTSGTGVYVHRWRYAAPVRSAAVPALIDTSTGAPIAFAGDAFVGGRLEGAARSGLAAAELLTDAARTA